MKLAMTLAVTVALSKSVVPAVLSQLKTRFSDELFQIAMVGYCMSCAWICGKLGLSHELGAFLAGIMVSTFEHHDSVASSTEQVRLATCENKQICVLLCSHCSTAHLQV